MWALCTGMWYHSNIFHYGIASVVYDYPSIASLPHRGTRPGNGGQADTTAKAIVVPANEIQQTQVKISYTLSRKLRSFRRVSASIARARGLVDLTSI